MLNPQSSPLFEAWTDPETGLEVWLLTAEPAPLQQSFYFVNDGFSRDGRYLWFYCAYPPSGSGSYGRTLAVVDSEAQTIHRFPDTQFQHASPFVDPDCGEVYWTTGASIWRRGPQPEAEAECVNSLPADVLRNRKVARLATHLSRSADGREFFVDVWLGAELVFGTLPVDGTDFQFWQRFDRHHNHAQFSPVDPDLVLFAQEGHTDLYTGLRIPITNRMWTIRRGEAPRPVFENPTVCSHEWWDVDGVHAWSVWQQKQTWRANVQTGESERFEWPVMHCLHSHSSIDGRYLVCDSTEQRFYRGCATAVHFMDRRTGKTIKIIDNPAIEGFTGDYHIDPHPRFCCGDRFVVFTTTVRGRVDMAVVRTNDLKDLTD